MSERAPKAADIADLHLLDAVRAVRGRNGVPAWATLRDVQEALSAWPAKVVQAKLRSAVKRGLLGGCACGCRGDFEERANAVDTRPPPPSGTVTES